MSGYNDSGGARRRNSRRRDWRGGQGRSGVTHLGLAGRITAGCVAFALVGGSLVAYVKYRAGLGQHPDGSTSPAT